MLKLGWSCRDHMSKTLTSKDLSMSRLFLWKVTTLSMVLVCSTALAQEDADVLGQLTFRDSFDYVNSDELMDEMGNGWSSNSKARAQGDKQAFVKDGYLNITTSPKADHAATVRRKLNVTDGSFQARIRLLDQKGINFQILDSAYKQSHAGHIVQIKIRPNKIILEDGKTGNFALPYYTKKKAGEATKEETAAQMEGKTTSLDVDIPMNSWQLIAVTFKGDVMTFYLDGRKLGSLQSEGVAHETKATFLIDVPGTADIDDVELHSFDN